jgi:hypothetical protein
MSITEDGIIKVSNVTAGLQIAPKQSLSFVASPKYIYPVDTTNNPVTAALPLNPSIGDVIQFTDYANKFATNNLTINPNGLKINSSALNTVVSTNNANPTLTYIDANQGWSLQVSAGGGSSGSSTSVTQTKKLNNVSAGATYNQGNQFIPAWQFTHTGTGAKTRIEVNCTGYSGGGAKLGFSLLRNGVVVASLVSGQQSNIHAFMGTMFYLSDSDTGTNTYQIRTNGSTVCDIDDYCTVIITEYFDVVSSSTWVSSTVPITATTTNPTKGTPSKDVMRYRKVGEKTYQLQVSYQQAAGGAGGSGIYLYTLPAGLQFEAGQIKNTNGNATTMAAATFPAKISGSTASFRSGNGTGQAFAVAYDATRFYLATTLGGGGAVYALIQNGVYFHLGLDLFMEVDFTFTATT